MKKMSMFALATLMTLPAFAQATRFVSVTPSAGTVDGGTEIIVRLDRPYLYECPILPPPPAFYVDGVSVPFNFDDETTLRAVTPPHARGPVGLRLASCGAPTIEAEDAFTFFDPRIEPDPSQWEPVLLPVFFFGPAGHGSQWVTTASVFNDGEEPVTFGRPRFVGEVTCPAVCGCDTTATILPSKQAFVCSTFASAAGVVLWAPREHAQTLSYHLRITDTSRTQAGLGTEIPVIHEHELKPGTIVLADVPVHPLYRSNLRVYDPFGKAGGMVTVRIFASQSGALLHQQDLSLQPPAGNDAVFNGTPSYAYLGNITALFPSVPEGAGLVRVEIEPRGHLGRFWAFISTTNNETQQITTITPQ